MKLTVMERLNVPIPQSGTIENQIIAKDLLEKVTLTQEEMKKIKGRNEKQDIVCPHCGKTVKEGEAVFRWDDDKYEKDIEFTQAELVLLKKEVDRLSREEAITQQTLSVCLKVSELFTKEKTNENIP